MITIIYIYMFVYVFTIVPKGGWRVNKISIRSLAINDHLVMKNPYFYSFKI